MRSLFPSWELSHAFGWQPSATYSRDNKGPTVIRSHNKRPWILAWLQNFPTPVPPLPALFLTLPLPLVCCSVVRSGGNLAIIGVIRESWWRWRLLWQGKQRNYQRTGHGKVTAKISFVCLGKIICFGLCLYTHGRVSLRCWPVSAYFCVVFEVFNDGLFYSVSRLAFS